MDGAVKAAHTTAKGGIHMSQPLGIDVSVHNGALDWTMLKAAGVQFAIIRAGYGR